MADSTFSTLVAVDTSSESGYTLLYFLDHFYKPGSRVILLHCIEIDELKKKKFSEPASPRPKVPFDNWMDKWEGGAKSDKMMARFKKLIQDKYPDVRMSYEVEPTEHVGKTIIEIAQFHQTSAVVVGSHGITYSKARKKPDSVHGSVTSYLLQHSPVPLIVTRYKGQDVDLGFY